jgi:chorismate dehydratase
MLYGLERGEIVNEIELTGNYPAKIAAQLVDGQIDIGLIPVAEMAQLPVYYIIGNYGIAANGEVASVCLFSQVPLNQIKRIYLDYQSKSSVALLKFLIEKYWKLNVELINTSDENFIGKVEGDSAALLIGDRALSKRKSSKYIYDLGTAWKEFTGKPFVFAAWVSIKPIDKEFEKKFDEANALGQNKIDEIVSTIDFPDYDLGVYYKEKVKYFLDDSAREGMNLFLDYLRSK